jgi:hypothetical protein
MKLKSSSIFMTIWILTFAVFSAASIEQSDKIFAKTLFSGDSSTSISGDKLNNGEKMRVIENVLGAIFGGGSQSNTPVKSSPNFASSDKSPSTDSSLVGDNSGKCIQSKGTGTKDYYCAGTHHHCVRGESPGCLLEGGRTK